MNAPIAQLLAGVSAFADLPSEHFPGIARYCALREYDAEQTVIAYGDTCCAVFFLVTGSVRATMFTQHGREISYQDLGPGEMFGELAAIDHLPRSTAVIAREKTRLLEMSGDDFQRVLATYPEVARATLHKMAGLVRFLCDRVYNFGALDVRSRVRAELSRLMLAQGQPSREHPGALAIRNMPRQQELANRLATHREAVSRELSALEKAGLVRKGRGTLLVLDPDGLQASIDT